ncbi:phosphoglycerate dehydrogenase [Heyndrickxia sporothermodurans]|uniref:phosphoglycerate dehydrogenase n=1 Tax=Heyndrickxia TaxID=2837504 RepID=UPI000D358D2D|nr:phosphoglycerate dehydrogenase [Heyndrickxia sporothermodurans]PTY79134.1 phosphoglycerate dehydrogenase [Heyndrickxia sporothermodurans]
MYKVLVTDSISDIGLKKLYEHPEFLVDKKNNLTELELCEIIKDYDALIVRSQTIVTKNLLEYATRLRVIARAGVGVDNIDLDSATRKGIIVINAPGANTIAATEHTLAMLLSLARKIPHAYQSTSKGEWKRGSFKGVELYEKTLGIVGMGKIGTEVAKRAKSFQMKILGFDPYLSDERAKKLGITKASLDEIAKQSDFITFHTPLTPETKGLVNDEYISKMKKGVRLVNCARGGIIVESALLHGLQSGQIAGAALDVFEQEPPTNLDLLQHPNIIATPHLGASTEEAQEKVAKEVSEEIISIFETNSIRHAINMPQISGEIQKKMKPFLELGEQIAQLAIQLFKQAPNKIDIRYSGELIEEDTSLLTRTMIKGILAYHLSDSVNIINAFHLLKEHGLTYNIEKNAPNKGFSNYMELSLSKGNEIVVIGGTVLNGYGTRIVKINNYRIDVKPEQHLLYIKHEDRPGMIGLVGSILGDYHINIGTMQVGRETIGGEAIMVLTLDKKIDDDVIYSLKLLNGLEEVDVLELSKEVAVVENY